jgi:hypothetical protein
MPVYIAIQSASTRQDRVDYPIKRAQAAVPRSPIYINIRPIYASAPAYKAAADSFICAASEVSRGLVYINIPGRTYLHELFIEYEQVTAWVARFSFKLEANYHQPPSALDGSMGRRTSRRHYSLVNFKSPVGRSHWPSC